MRGGGLECSLRCCDHPGLGVGQALVTGFDRFARTACQHLQHGNRQIDAISTHDCQGIFAGGRIGNGRPRCDVNGIVAGYIGYEQGGEAGRMTGGSQAPPLDGRQMSAHTIHFADGRAGSQQGPVDQLFVFERDAGQGRREQGRSPTRYQAQHLIVGGESLGHVEQSLCGRQAGLVRYRVSGFENFDAFAGHCISVAGDHQPGQLARPMLLDRLGHGGRRLASADDDEPAITRGRGQVVGYAAGGLGRGDGRVEHRPHQCPRIARMGGQAGGPRRCVLVVRCGRHRGRAEASE